MQEWRSSILWFGGGAAALLLPLAIELLSPVYGLGLFLLAVLLFSRKNLRLWPLLLFAAFLDWQWLSTLWSDHSTAGWKDVIMVLPIGVMGVVLHLFSLHDGTHWSRKWLQVFAWATLAAWTFIFFKSLYLNGWVSYKKFELSSRLGVHFQSLYVLAALLVLERDLWQGSIRRNWPTILACLWLFTGLFLLSSRIHLLLIPVIIIGRFYEFTQVQKTNRTLLYYAAAGIFISGVLFTILLPGPRNRMIDLRNELRSMGEKVDGKQTNHRIFIWKEGWDIVQEHPLFGLGNGAGEFELNQRLDQLDVRFFRGADTYTFSEFFYDFHNIWLQSLAEGGLVAAVLLGALFLWGIRSSSGTLRYLWLVLILSGTTESLFDKQAGSLFIAFLVAITALSSSKLEGTTEDPSPEHLR